MTVLNNEMQTTFGYSKVIFFTVRLPMNYRDSDSWNCFKNVYKQASLFNYKSSYFDRFCIYVIIVTFIVKRFNLLILKCTLEFRTVLFKITYCQSLFRDINNKTRANKLERNFTLI